ncbi:hypothetical protein V2J09_018245 [Rumex salicifolius]
MESKQFLILFLLSVSTAPAPASALVGGYQPIKDPNDPYVVEIAKFAVTEHNKNKSDDLSFVKVVSGQQQVVAGTNYNLVIVADHPGADSGESQYQALVYDRPWQKFRSLTSFQKV